MIKPEDLRIGNLFNPNLSYINEKRQCELLNFAIVTSIDNLNIGFTTNIPRLNVVPKLMKIDRIEPIKLTPEILGQIECCALENGFYEIGRLTIDFNRDAHGYFLHSAFIKDSLIDNFNYLHELQNIYYYTHKKQELPIDINTLKI